jgi:hypothetical protein
VQLGELGSYQLSVRGARIVRNVPFSELKERAEVRRAVNVDIENVRTVSDQRRTYARVKFGQFGHHQHLGTENPTIDACSVPQLCNTTTAIVSDSRIDKRLVATVKSPPAI